MASIASPLAPSAAPSGDWQSRARKPLAVTATLLIAIDCIGLGLHLADETRQAANPQPQARAQARVTAPEAVVDSSTVDATAPSTNRTRATTPTGVFIGPVAPPIVVPPGTNPPGANPSAPPTTAPAVPLAQAGIAVPALGAQVSLGLGDNSCTTVDLTLLALGNCPAPEGDGAVILQLGGALLGD